MTSVTEIIDKQDDYIKQTNIAFEEVKDSIDKSMASINTISQQAESLDAERVTVVNLIENLSAIAEENAAGTEQTSASVTEIGAITENVASNAERLKDISNSLDSNIKQFRV